MLNFSNLFPGAKAREQDDVLSAVIKWVAIMVGLFIYFVAGVAVANYILGCLR